MRGRMTHRHLLDARRWRSNNILERIRKKPYIQRRPPPSRKIGSRERPKSQDLESLRETQSNNERCSGDWHFYKNQ